MVEAQIYYPKHIYMVASVAGINYCPDYYPQPYQGLYNWSG